jgi:hypothetical protein
VDLVEERGTKLSITEGDLMNDFRLIITVYILEVEKCCQGEEEADDRKSTTNVADYR